MEINCPQCGEATTHHAYAEDIEYFTSEKRFEFRHCMHCDILFVSPMLYDALGEIYPPNYYSFVAGKRGFVQAVKEVLDRRWMRGIMRDVSGDSLSVLDVGGGTGWLLDVVKSSDPRVAFTQVVDIDEDAKVSAEAAGHRYFLGPIERFETDRNFDVILMLNLIEHVPQPGIVLAKAAKLLSPTGRLLVKTPNFVSLDARLFRHRSWGGYHTPRHFVLFNRDSFVRLVEANGLQVEAFSYTQGAPFWSASVMNELRKAGLVSASKERPLVFHPIMPIFMAMFAAIDFARRPFARLSQMQVVLRRATPIDSLTPRSEGMAYGR